MRLGWVMLLVLFTCRDGHAASGAAPSADVLSAVFRRAARDPKSIQKADAADAPKYFIKVEGVTVHDDTDRYSKRKNTWVFTKRLQQVCS